MLANEAGKRILPDRAASSSGGTCYEDGKQSARERTSERAQSYQGPRRQPFSVLEWVRHLVYVDENSRPSSRSYFLEQPVCGTAHAVKEANVLPWL